MEKAVLRFRVAFFYSMSTIIQIAFFTASVLLLAGLIQPWWVLWWMSHQNRVKVLKYYGVPWLILGALFLLF